jgi:hypothetical protein
MCDVVHTCKKKSFRGQATSGSNPYPQIPGSISATFWIEAVTGGNTQTLTYDVIDRRIHDHWRARGAL